MKAKYLLEQYALGKRDFQNASLWGAYLVGAYLRGANLVDTYLVGADLRGANLVDTDLSGADLRGADLMDADLRNAKIDDGKIMTGYFTRTRIGSEASELQVAYNASEIWLKRGCSGWLTPVEFLERVQSTHGDNIHAQIYRLTVAHCVEIVALERQLQNEGDN